jgi:cell division protein FtsZ
MFEMIDPNQNLGTKKDLAGAKIRVIGVGGGGGNAVNTMIKANLTGVEYIVANTDAQALQVSLAPIKIQLGNEITKGLGAGANPEVGRKSAIEEYEKLSEVLTGADMIFVTAGMGGGTGTGAAPVIAKLAKELGALTVGVVTKPFLFEGKRRHRQAENGILSLEESVDSLITIPNQRLLQLAGENLSLVDTFKKADEVLLNAVQGISDLINHTGLINADFADVSTVMANKGLSLMGTGVAQGPDRAIKAASEAISSPLLEDISIDGATGIIINITGNSKLTTYETNEAVTLIMEAADEDAEIIFGTVIDDSMGDFLKVTVIATGLGEKTRKRIKNFAIPSVQNYQQNTKNLSENTLTEEPVAKNNFNPIQNKNDHLEKSNDLFLGINDQVDNIQKKEIQEINIKTPEHFDFATPNIIPEVTPSLNQDQVVEVEKVVPDFASKFKEDTGLQMQQFQKAKSLAEKLGFINFGDDELDTPAFLRKDKVQGINKTNILGDEINPI